MSHSAENLRRVASSMAIIMIGALLLAAATAHASSPLLPGDTPAVPETPTAVSPVLNYQGRLLNSSTGAPLNGSFTFVFRLYNVAGDGTPLWSETKDLTVTNGLFSTLLGDATALPTTIFNGQDLWLGIKVGTDAEATPRQRIGAVVYALYSDNAERLAGQGGAYYRNASNINAGVLADARIPDAITRDSEVAPILLAADGEGSGLDADLLDGQTSAAFAGASHNHDSRYVNTSGDAMSGSSSSSLLSVVNASTATSAYGIDGSTASTAAGVAGVRGSAGSPGTTIAEKHGVLGQSDTGKGVVGVSQSSVGVFGWSTNTWGVRGEGQYGGVYGLSWSPGSDSVFGNNTATTGASWGVRGASASPSGRGVVGMTSSGTGATYGVYGSSNSSDGGAGVRGDSTYVGVWGESSGRWGVYGKSTGTSNSYGVVGNVADGAGNYAGYFMGDVRVTGELVKSSGAFMIDHPLDPENKYLNHSFVESPDMMNIYNGNATLDGNGEAWVELPGYFEALNRDFRYQLTAVGRPGPNLFVVEGVQGNRFKIAGGEAGMQVSWQVTGIRQDPYANAHRIVVEEEKPAAERGRYLHPEVYGQDIAQSIDNWLHGEPLAPSQTDEIQQQKLADDPAFSQPQSISGQ